MATNPLKQINKGLGLKKKTNRGFVSFDLGRFDS